MQILWTHLKPYRWLILLSLVLAGIAQLLNLVDPIIFGKIIDEYALRPGTRTETELVSGVLRLLAIAVVVALLSRLAKALGEYEVRLVVQKFGMQIFNDGIRQTLRLSYPEFMHERSGETLSILQKTRTDTERFTTGSRPQPAQAVHPVHSAVADNPESARARELLAMQFITAQIFLPLQDLGNIILLYREADASPVEGQIYYNGISTKDLRFNSVRRQFGFVTQETELFSDTLRENLRFVKPNATDAETLEALAKAAATSALDSHGRLNNRHGQGSVAVR